LEIAEKLTAIDQNKVLNELQDLNCLVRENLKDIRRIIFDLRPIGLDNSGIVDNIKKYIANYEKTYGIDCQLIIDGAEKPLSLSIKAALFRLVQEGMINAAKHAESPKVTIHIEHSGERDQGENY
jgi:two-component system sensor histidine kinase DegS